jgi:hypothetical protein
MPQKKSDVQEPRAFLDALRDPFLDGLSVGSTSRRTVLACLLGVLGCSLLLVRTELSNFIKAE